MVPAHGAEKETREMKKYLIHERKAGAQTDKLLELVPIFADNPDEAAERFTEWVLTWMGNDNSESAIAETAELREYIAASGNIYDYSFDGVRYWFEEEPEPEPDPEPEDDPLAAAMKRIAQNDNISQAFRDGLKGEK